MTKPEDIPQDVWEDSKQKASDYLCWIDECWPKTSKQLPMERLLERLTYDLSHAIMAAKAEERRVCYDLAIAELLSGESEDENDKSYDRGVGDAANAIRNRDTV